MGDREISSRCRIVNKYDSEIPHLIEDITRKAQPALSTGKFRPDVDVLTTAHKSKGLEADYVIILQCNKDTYGFPSLVSDDPVLNYVLTKSDQYPYGEERRLFYVAITRAKVKTYILYDRRFPSVFVDEFLHPEKITEESYAEHPNANKKWTRSADNFLLTLYHEGKSISGGSGTRGSGIIDGQRTILSGKSGYSGL